MVGGVAEREALGAGKPPPQWAGGSPTRLLVRAISPMRVRTIGGVNRNGSMRIGLAGHPAKSAGGKRQCLIRAA